MAYENYIPKCWSNEYQFIEYSKWDKPCKAIHKKCGTEIYVTRTANFNHRKQKCPVCYPIWTKEKRQQHALITKEAMKETEEDKQNRIQRIREYSRLISCQKDKEYEQIINSTSNMTFVSSRMRNHKKYLTLLCNSCNIEQTYRVDSIIKHNQTIQCPICNSFKHSKQELELLEYINNFGYKAFPIHLDKFEIDIYIPQLKIGFEYNGIYWHSDIFCTPNEHYNKKLKFLRHGIQLFYLWEHNHDINKDIILSILNNTELPSQIKYCNNELNADVHRITTQSKWKKPIKQTINYDNKEFIIYNSGTIVNN